MAPRYRPRPEPISPELRELLEGVQRLPCSYSRREMLRVLKRLAGRRVFIARRELVAPDELALALELLSGMRVVEVRDALMVRLDCGKTKAYKLITAALQARAGLIPAAHAEPHGLRQLASAIEDDGED